MKEAIKRQIDKITSELIKVNLSVEQFYPSLKDGNIYISGKHDLSIALKNIPYEEIYKTLEKDKNYNIKMIDGGLIQFMYSFDGNELKKYRLAFFPSPYLEEFQNERELYELDEVYADVIERNIVATPIRFDYDPSPEAFHPIEHPKSHVTIGQYKNCRIPVICPITPYIFMDFILRNFYNTAHTKFSDDLNFDKVVLFESCIEDVERQILHISLV